jgi:hypothetical protein
MTQRIEDGAPESADSERTHDDGEQGRDRYCLAVRREARHDEQSKATAVLTEVGMYRLYGLARQR